jgi:hypothetical protein
MYSYNASAKKWIVVMSVFAPNFPDPQWIDKQSIVAYLVQNVDPQTATNAFKAITVEKIQDIKAHYSAVA